MFALGTFAGEDGDPFPGLVVDERVHDLRPALTSTLSMLQDWDASLTRLRALAASPPDEGTPLGELRPLPPVSPSGQVLCAGANYRKHLHQMVVAHLMVATAGLRAGDTPAD